MKYEAFSKKLIDEVGVQSEKLDVIYNESDSRCWTAVIGKGRENLLVTFHVNHGEPGNRDFDVIGHRKNLTGVSTYDIYEVITNNVKIIE